MAEPADLSARLGSDLLRIGAVRFSPDEPFTWTSGLRSPVYCDNRLTIGHPDVRRRITDGFLSAIASRGVSADVVAGTATAGIPHAAWLADRLDKPLVYVRSKPKGHGIGSRIEGPLTPGQNVVLVEDLVSTGGSSIDAVGALREAGQSVKLVVAIFSYGLPRATQAFRDAGVPLVVLTNLEALLNRAEQENLLEPTAIEGIREWRSDPERWSETFQDERSAPE